MFFLLYITHAWVVVTGINIASSCCRCIILIIFSAELSSSVTVATAMAISYGRSCRRDMVPVLYIGRVTRMLSFYLDDILNSCSQSYFQLYIFNRIYGYMNMFDFNLLTVIALGPTASVRAQAFMFQFLHILTCFKLVWFACNLPVTRFVIFLLCETIFPLGLYCIILF